MPTLSPQTTPYYGGGQVVNPADVIQVTGTPSSADIHHNLGTIAVQNSNGHAWVLSSKSGGTAGWEPIGGGALSIATLTGDSGGAISPVAGNITIAGGTNLTTAGTAGTITVNLDAVVSVATSVTSALLATSTAATNLQISGQTIATSGSDANVNLLLTTKAAGLIVWSQSKAGVDMNLQITNSDNTAAAGHAGIQLAVGGSTSTGDPYISFQISGVGASTMTMGLDNSSSDTFVISNSTVLGTSNALTLTQAGALGVTTSITAGTTLTATLGAITATNGNFVGSTAGTGLLLNSPAASGAAASPVVVNGRSGRATFTSVSIAAAADLTLTLTNSSITAATTQIIFAMSGATTGSALSVKSVTPGSGTCAFVITNGTGATTSTADIVIDFLVVNA